MSPVMMDRVSKHLNEVAEEQARALTLIQEALKAIEVAQNKIVQEQNKLIQEQQTAIVLIQQSLTRLEIAHNKLQNVITMALNWRGYAEGDGLVVSGDGVGKE